MQHKKIKKSVNQFNATTLLYVKFCCLLYLSGHGEKDILLSNLFFQIMSKFKVLNFDQTPIVNTIILQFSNMLFLILNLLEQSYRLNFTLVDEC